MVASPRSSSKLASPMSAKKNKISTPDHKPETEISPPEEKLENGISSPAKRKNNPGVRVHHGRIYDSENGKTCHQCRQKTRDFSAACKGINPRTNKPCPILFCHKCLSNRYGENAEVVGALEEWSCPKCRGICNCSVCMKKQGHQPTGILIHTAKAKGCLSVTELLQKGGHEKRAASEMIPVSNSPRKRGKENKLDGGINANLTDSSSPSNPVKAKPVKVVVEGSDKMNNHTKDPVDGCIKTRKPKKLRASKQAKASNENCDSVLQEALTISGEGNVCDSKLEMLDEKRDSSKLQRGLMKQPSMGPDEKVKNLEQDKPKAAAKKKGIILVPRTRPRKHHISNGIVINGAKHNTDADPQGGKLSKEKDSENNDTNAEIPLPEGFELSSIRDIGIPPKDVGTALQFLEFCAVFGKMLGVSKGQPEVVLRDLMQGRSSRRGKHSAAVYFIVQMLSIIQTERGQGSSESALREKDAWINALNECISESGSLSKLLDLGNLDNKIVGFEYTDSSEKLRVINFLCDEILGTAKIRDWIDEKVKEDKERVLAAKDEHKGKVLAIKDKEKSLKQQMQDEIASSILKKNGACLSIAEHDAIVSKIQREVAAAHTELVGLNVLPYKKNKSIEVLRTEPIHLGIDGRAYWKLKCMANKSDSEILQQDVGTGEKAALDEKWYAFEDEQREEIDKRISSVRGKRLRAQRIA